MDERIYGDLVALCQFLPGPASSQVGMGVGLLRGGVFGLLFHGLGSLYRLCLFWFSSPHSLISSTLEVLAGFMG